MWAWSAPVCTLSKYMQHKSAKYMGTGHILDYPYGKRGAFIAHKHGQRFVTEICIYSSTDWGVDWGGHPGGWGHHWGWVVFWRRGRGGGGGGQCGGWQGGRHNHRGIRLTCWSRLSARSVRSVHFLCVLCVRKFPDPHKETRTKKPLERWMCKTIKLFSQRWNNKTYDLLNCVWNWQKSISVCVY